MTWGEKEAFKLGSSLKELLLKEIVEKARICTYVYNIVVSKGQLNSEWINEVIVSPKMPTKNLKDFCSGSLLEGRAEILQIFGWHFGRNDDLINSFWI